MSELSSDTIGVLRRELRDARSLTANMDHKLRQVLDGARPLERAGGLTARHAAVAVRAFTEKRSREDIARQMYSGDRDLAHLIERAVTGPAATSTPWASELVDIAVADILTNVMPASVLSQLRTASGMEFLFVDGAIVRVPSHQPQANGTFVLEGGPIPVAQLLLASVSLPQKKCAAIIAFSKELASGTSINIETGFRTLLQQDLALAVDAVLLDANPATPTRPAGLLNGLSSLTPAATGTPAEKITKDLRTLLTAIAPALTPVVLTSTLDAVTLSIAAPEVPRIVSASVPTGTLIAVDVSSFISALGPADFSLSENPLVNTSDPALPIVGGTAQPPVIGSVAAPTMSMWQQGAIGMRCIVPVNWGLRRASSVAFISGVTW